MVIEDFFSIEQTLMGVCECLLELVFGDVGVDDDGDVAVCN